MLYTSLTITVYISYLEFVPTIFIFPVKFNKEISPNFFLIFGIIGLVINLTVNIGSRIKAIRDNVRYLKIDLNDLENKILPTLGFKDYFFFCLKFSIGIFFFL